jgi:hypothetical protein
MAFQICLRRLVQDFCWNRCSKKIFWSLTTKFFQVFSAVCSLKVVMDSYWLKTGMKSTFWRFCQQICKKKCLFQDFCWNRCLKKIFCSLTTEFFQVFSAVCSLKVAMDSYWVKTGIKSTFWRFCQQICKKKCLFQDFCWNQSSKKIFCSLTTEFFQVFSAVCSLKVAMDSYWLKTGIKSTF